LGGFVFTQMGRVPAVAESFEWQGLRFEIVDMDGKRIDKVLVMAREAVNTETSLPNAEALLDRSATERPRDG
jgi:putative hemolysin